MEGDDSEWDFLLLFVHGNNGSSSDWNAVIDRCKDLQQKKNFFLFLYEAKQGTLRGVQMLADELVDQVLYFVNNEMKSKTKKIFLYVVGHSLGGVKKISSLKCFNNTNLVLFSLCCVLVFLVSLKKNQDLFLLDLFRSPLLMLVCSVMEEVLLRVFGNI